MKTGLTILTIVLCALAPQVAAAQEQTEEKKPSFEVFGFAMLDAGYDFKQQDPAWFDVLRLTKLPAFENEFGTDGNTYFGVRQSRFGVKGYVPTEMGDLKTWFEWELFGVGVDEGQTTIRLRHAYGELGQFGAGQTFSPFMDNDVFPNSYEYWGPTGMILFRNVQVRWMPIQGDTRMTIALERPGASADQGIYEDRIELQGVKARFPYPDLSAEYRCAGDWGYVEGAGMLRYLKWEDQVNDAFDLSGDATAWGLSLSSNLKPGDNVIRLQLVYGEGVENYMNDAPSDIAIENQPGNATAPIKGVPLPMLGAVVFFEHNWNEKWSSTIGWSMAKIENTDGQAVGSYKEGQYALANVSYYPVKDVTFGLELQYGKRKELEDGIRPVWEPEDARIQFAAKYAFSALIK